MDIGKRSLKDLLVGNQQFIVPIYQRTYDWDYNHCRQLYDDIVHAGQNNTISTHFMGAITYYTLPEPIPDVWRHELIDGQQRITTLLLLLVALKHELGDQIQRPGRIDQLLYNTAESKDSDRYLKIKLNQKDNDVFEEIIKMQKTDRSGSIRANYERLCKWVSQDKMSDKFNVIWRGIQKLVIVQIATDKQDDAQRIFESMNSTGLDLSTTDLVQNRLLMKGDLNWQEKVYNDHWLPMEKIFEDNRSGFDDYLRHYLMMKQKTNVTKKRLYQKIKEYAVQYDGDILSDLHKYAKHYACLLYPEWHKTSSEKLNRQIVHIHDQNTDVAHPLLLSIIGDYENKLISEDDATDLFALIDSYLLRCGVAGTAKNLNRAIPVVMSRLDKDNYVESVKKAMLERGGKDRFPSDSIFKRNFIDKEFYKNDRVSVYILRRLAEKYQDTSALRLDELTIEHIMPRKLSESWKADLGDKYDEIHNAHLRQIGNLTLTEDNPALSNNSFADKQKIYASSVVKMTAALHSSRYKQWSADEILRRSEQLADDAIKVWKYPDGYTPNSDDGDELEQDHLDGTNVTLLWRKLKESILAKCPDAIFEMKQRYANFKVSIPNFNRYGLICSIAAQKCKIYVVYNTHVSEKVVPPSNFVEDISNVRHLCVGDLRSKIYDDVDVKKATELVEQVYAKKLEG